MKYKLICRKEYICEVKTLIESFGLTPSDDYDILFAEKNDDNCLQENHFSFHCDRIPHLEKFLRLLVAEAFKNNHLLVKDKDSYVPLSYEDIFHVSAGNNCSYVFSDVKFKVSKTLLEMEKKLRSKGFLRINKSEIVNIQKIKRIDPWFSSRFVLRLKNDVELVVTKSYCKAFKEYIGL